MLRFNGSEDVFCLVKVNLDILDAVDMALSKSSAPGLDDGNDTAGTETPGLDWVQRVTKLALDEHNTSFYEDFGFSLAGEVNQNHVPKLMAAFSKLQWLFFVPLPSPDDMATVKVRDNHSAANMTNEAEQGEEGDDEEDSNGEDESQSASINSTNGDIAFGLNGSWIRGENGISDWYGWVPPRTTWEYSNDVVEAHFHEVESSGGFPSCIDES
jgi:hypothetical protein